MTYPRDLLECSGDRDDPRTPTRRPLRARPAPRGAAGGHVLPAALALPFPVEEFLVRPGELAAWVAVEDDAVVGHVSVTELTDGRMASEWANATGRTADGLAEVSVLFVAGGRAGSGIGGALLDAALAEIRRRGLTPMLDVVGEDTGAGRGRRRRGWRTVGTARPPWLPDHRPDLAFMLLDDERVDP